MTVGEPERQNEKTGQWVRLRLGLTASEAALADTTVATPTPKGPATTAVPKPVPPRR